MLGEEQKKQGWLLGYSSLTAHEIEVAMQRLARALKTG
jgi:GntR family transcriptional regulator/MocR family aminotransferase